MTFLRTSFAALTVASLLVACAKGADTGGAGGEEAGGSGPGSGGKGGAGGGGCTPGAKEACYSGPKDTADVGICKAGTHTCKEDGSGFGACDGEVVPTDEDCITPEDEDCDGAAPLCPGAAIWSERFGDASNQRLLGMATDSDGNVFLTGYFSGVLDFGGQELTSAGGSDIFVAKLDPTGKHLWSKHYGDEQEQYANAIAVDAAGDVYVTGEFKGKVNFGSAELLSAGSIDAFLAKLDGGSGSQLWSKKFGDSSDQSGRGVACDSTGNVVVTGSMAGTVGFGGPILTSDGGNDVFVAKFQSSGIHSWSVRFGDPGGGAQSAQAVTIDSNGDPIVVGSFVGGRVLDATNLTSGGGADIFVAKLAGASGAVSWATGFGAGSDQLARDVAVDPGDNVILVGSFQGTVDFGGVQMTSSGADDAFVAKLDPSGAHVWSQKYGDAMAQVARSVAVDGTGNIAVTGGFAGTVDFGGSSMTTKGGDDLFIARFDPDGAHLASHAYGDASDQTGQAIAFDADGNTLVAGDLKGTIDLGGGPLKSAGYYDIFVAKFAP